MHTRTMRRAVVGAAAAVLFAGTAQAALVQQGTGDEVLDTDTNLLWLYNWSSISNVNWLDAGTWAAGLTVGGATAGSWRLSEIGEYAALWVNPAVGGQFAGLQSNFTNLQANLYWSGTEGGLTCDTCAVMTFDTRDGREVFWGRLNGSPAVAVRAVPEPQTYALMLLGLGAGALLMRRRRH